MKKAARYLKQLFSAVVAAVKSTAVGTRASSLRTRLIVLGIMRNKKLLLSVIQSKIHAIMGGGGGAASGSGLQGAYAGNAAAEGSEQGGAGEHLFRASAATGGGGRKAAVLQSLPSFVVEQESRAVVLSSLPSFALERDGGGLAQSPLAGGGGEEVEYNDGSAGGAEKQAAEGEFRLEDEIDRVADVFIRRFHDQMKLQKLESFKRFCEMLERGA